MEKWKHLFAPGKIGSLYVKNRIVMAPLGSRLTTENGAVTEDMIEFYSQRARGGAGIIVIEAMAIDYPLGAGKPNHVRFHDDCYVPGHAKLVEKIHECGGKAFALLWHTGINRGMLEGMTPVGPSAILNPNTGIVPHELAVDEIHDIVKKFGQAAARAQTCGYDGLNVHGAHGYLISSFVSAATNKRTDEYGGSFENRLRFPLEVVAAIRANTRRGYPLVIRINGDDFIESGITQDEAVKFAQALEKAGVDAIDVSAGVYGSIDTMIEPIQYEEGWKLYLAENIRKNVNIPVFGVGVIHSPEVAEKALADGMVDFVAIGREWLAEPQWANKVRSGDYHFPKCIGCNACFERIGKNLPLRCALNPLAGRELHVPAPAVNAQKIAVVGGGPAGITAAVTASKRGHQVTLFEKTSQLGGQLILAAAPPGKKKIQDYIDYLKAELARSTVTVHLDAEFTAADAENFQQIVLATGAHCRDMAVSGSDGIRMLAWDALKLPKEYFDGRNVIVVGAGSVGCETAQHIRAGGANTVSIVELRGKIAADVDNISRLKLLHEMEKAAIGMYPSTVLDHVANAVGKLKNINTQVMQDVLCDLVVVAIGSLSEQSLAQELYEKGIVFHTVGDCQCIGKIGEAVRGGFDAVATL